LFISLAQSAYSSSGIASWIHEAEIAEAAFSTACPSVALADSTKYKILILTMPEFEVLVGERQCEEYGFDKISLKN
jgi:diphthamide synthase subunit DPH2